MKRTFALLVGINNYPSPIAPLNGCTKDLDLIEEYLLLRAGRTAASAALVEGELPVRSFDDRQICRLQNEQATHENITRGFRSFLQQAGPDDIVWFHFSGHGSEQFTADEFLELEPNGKDQTLVCYQPASGKGRLHLADKELAVLLHQVATQDTEGQPKASPHIVVSLDCCHSGSGTRDFAEDPQLKTRHLNHLRGMTRRQAVQKGTVRTIDTYAGGFYAQQWREKEHLEIPAAPHVLLAACQSIEKAGDLPAGGVFTTGFIHALTQAQGNINYADLFIRTRASVQRIRRAQMPQFETIANFDPYTRFLEGSALGTPDRYEVKHENNQWIVKCGAIHGLPLQAQPPVEVTLFVLGAGDRPIGSGLLTSVGAQSSRLKLTGATSLDQKKVYQAVLRHLPAAPVWVQLTGDEAPLEALKKHWDASRNIRWIEEEPNDVLPQLAVKAANGRYHLHDLRSGRLITDTPQTDFAGRTVDNLGKIVQWERTIALDNPKSAIRNWVDFELGVMDNKQERTCYSASEIKLYASKNNYFFNPKDGSLGAPFFPRVRVKEMAQDLYFYLLHLRPNFSIQSYEGEVVFRSGEHEGDGPVELPLWKKMWGWGLSKGEPNATCYFKLLVTTEPLDHQQLLQSGLDAHRDTMFVFESNALSDEWCSHNIKVTMVRQEVAITPTEEAVLAGGRLRIRPQPHVSARLGLAAGVPHAASPDPAARFGLFVTPETVLVDLGNDPTYGRQRVLELTDLKLDDPNVLADTPLEVVLEEHLEAGEALVPVVFDGRGFRVVGDARAERGRTIVSIRELPLPAVGQPSERELVTNPFDAGQRQHRSLYEAVKVGFFRSSDQEGLKQRLATV